MLHEDNTSDIKRITWIGIFINLGLSALKLVVGLMGNSRAVVADGFHSLSDLATDFAVIFGVRFWTAPPDEDHPFGHRRIETIIAASIALSLGAVGVALCYNAIATVKEAHPEQTQWFAISGPLLSIVLKEFLYRRTIAIGRKNRSRAVVANAWHHRSDAFSSIPALLAVIFAAFDSNLAFVDHIGAVLISIFILKASWDILKPALSELTDRGATEKELAEIHSVANSVSGVAEVHKIRTRRLGESICVDLHVLVDPEMTVFVGHGISEKVKEAIITRGPNVIDVVVHLEPFSDK